MTEELDEPLDARVPEFFVAAEPVVRALEGPGVNAAIVNSAADGAFHEAGAFQSADVLGRRGEGHVARRGELADRVLAPGQPVEHGAPGLVAEGLEDEVESPLLFNHMVKYSATAPPSSTDWLNFTSCALLARFSTPVLTRASLGRMILPHPHIGGIVARRPSRFTLTAHVVLSVGWLGSVLAYLALAVTGMASAGPDVVRGTYRAMLLIGWWVIVPCSGLALLSGLLKSIDTRWGLARHWWVVAKVVLSLVGMAVLVRHMRAVAVMADLAAARSLGPSDFHMERLQLVIHPAGGLALLVVVTALSIYKPWGLTPYGERAGLIQPPAPRVVPAPRVHGGAPLPWPRIIGAHAIGLLAVLVILHIAGGGLRHH